MLHKTYFFRFLFFIVLFQNGFSQTLAGADVKDSQTWTAVGFSYKINKKWNVTLEEQLRLKDNSNITDQYFTELGVEYNPFKHVEFAIGSRYINDNDTEGNNRGYDKLFRFHIDGVYFYKINRFSFKHRLRYQNRNKLGENDDPIINTRFKTSIAYNIRSWKLDPKISGEIFKRFEKNEVSRYNKYRITFETQCKIKKIGSISLFYRIDQELNIINAERLKILGLMFLFKLK